MTKTSVLAAALSLVVLTACQPEKPQPDTVKLLSTTVTAPPKPQPTDPTSAKPQPAGPATEERIAEIVASGKTGFWSDVTEVCPKDRPVPSATLTWNVTGSGVEGVVVYVVDPKIDTDDVGRLFNQSGPVGERRTGPWLKPGLMFKLRSKGDDTELGSITIGERPC